MNNKQQSIEQTAILELADRCVKCGLCSTHCPTYKLSGDENESPRGRIALAQALASNSLQDISKAELHLENCLHCRRCEKVCPSGVDYGQLKDATSELIKEYRGSKKQKRFEEQSIRFISISNHKKWRKISRFWRWLQAINAQKMFLTLTNKQKFLSYLPKQTKPIQQPSEKAARKSNSVSLFTGCLSHVFDSATLNDSISLLNHCGHDTNIPEKQNCCGGLAQHSGYKQLANTCQQQNEQTFNEDSAQTVVFTATGCGMTLKEQDGMLANKATEICHFLNNSELFSDQEFLPLAITVVVHTPCSERNALKQYGEIEKALSNIPDLNIISLPENISCCGAGGNYMFTHQDKAAQIREAVLDQIEKHKPDLVVSSNYTCRMHLQAGLHEKALDTATMHPISLLWQQLKK